MPSLQFHTHHPTTGLELFALVPNDEFRGSVTLVLNERLSFGDFDAMYVCGAIIDDDPEDEDGLLVSLSEFSLKPASAVEEDEPEVRAVVLSAAQRARIARRSWGAHPVRVRVEWVR